MTQIVRVEYQRTTYYAIQWSWLGLFKRYRDLSTKHWWTGQRHIQIWCLSTDLQLVKHRYNELIQKVDVMRVTPLYETKVEEAIYAD